MQVARTSLVAGVVSTTSPAALGSSWTGRSWRLGRSVALGGPGRGLVDHLHWGLWLLV